MHYQKALLSLLITLASCITRTDPIVYLKNNSKSRLMVEPLAANTTFRPAVVMPEDQTTDEYAVDSTGEPITGIRIRYCPNTAAATCNTDDAAFDKAAETTTFNFKAPKAKKYYVKLTIDANNNVKLEAQKGRLGFTSGKHKYSLSGNIKTEEIEPAPTRPEKPAPEILKAAPKMGVNAPTAPSMEQPAERDTQFFKKQLQAISQEFERIKALSAVQKITREDLENVELFFAKSTQKYKKLQDESAQYQLTQDETSLIQKIDDQIANLKNTIMRLKEFLKIPSQESSIKKPEPVLQNKVKPVSDKPTLEERQRVLQAVKTIAPALYEFIIKVDPTGEYHIRRCDCLGATVRPSSATGLPVINIDYRMFDWPFNEMLFTIAHELAHYILGHAYEDYHYPSEDALKLARSRIKENEADRIAIIKFGINLDDAINGAQRYLDAKREYDLQDPYKKTFKTTHPLWVDRIKHLESLRSEIELNKARNAKPEAIDWEALAQEYKQRAQKDVIPQIVQKYLDKKYTQDEVVKYANSAKDKYKYDRKIELIAEQNKDPDSGNPWVLDSIKQVLQNNQFWVNDSIKNMKATQRDKEAYYKKLTAAALDAYYNAKMFALKFQKNEDIKKYIYNALEELLNTEISDGKKVVNLIQEFEK